MTYSPYIQYLRTIRELWKRSHIKCIKGLLISKAIYGLLTSPQKRKDKFFVFAFLLFKANKSNSSIRLLGESTARQSAFWFFLTFRVTKIVEFLNDLLGQLSYMSMVKFHAYILLILTKSGPIKRMKALLITNLGLLKVS